MSSSGDATEESPLVVDARYDCGDCCILVCVLMLLCFACRCQDNESADAGGSNCGKARTNYIVSH